MAILQLETVTDREIWEYAKANDFVIVTRDSDFHELGTLYGAPPKVIWLKTGKQSKTSTLRSLLDRKEEITAALLQEDKGCIEIYG